jgi:hypothetical protein
MGRTADAIAEGLQIAASAARLAVKNRILVGTIADDEGFDVDRFLRFARETVLSLANEQEQGARAVQRHRKKAWGRHRDPMGTHDYGDRDLRNLRRRYKLYVGTAKGLRELADDEDRLSELVEQARESAWADVAGNLERRLRVEGKRADSDPEYDSMRNARMAAVTIDLERLAAHRRVRDDDAEADDRA